MVVESNRLTSMIPCVDHHIHKKPRRASRASAAGHYKKLKGSNDLCFGLVHYNCISMQIGQDEATLQIS